MINLRVIRGWHLFDVPRVIGAGTFSASGTFSMSLN
jgi:hypothetical protein